MSVIETRMSVWEALAGRAPGRPVGPADPGLWQAVAERLNPARAKPLLRDGIEAVTLTSARGVDYVMLRSPDGARACYLRLSPQEWQLAQLMDGTRTVARLVAEFARLAGRLAPDQVTRVVADLAGNRMLEELPVDAFHRLQRVHRRPLPVRLGRGLLAAARGQRVVLASVDPIIGLLYRAGGKLLFTRPVAILSGLVALVGLGLFVYAWMVGEQSVFLTSDSYVTGALVLLGLNVFALMCHEFGHALATKHAGRRVPAAGFLVYFGIPSVFVDTTDVWMAGRKARIITTAAGPATGLVLAGVTQVVGLFFPELAPWTFKLAFAWYLNALFNLNPFLALDGYYLLMDWLEVPNLRARGLAWVSARLRRRPPRFGELDREGRLVALYGMLAVVWLAIAVNIAYRVYTDRVTGLVTGLWRSGWTARVLLVVLVLGLAAPLVWALMGWLGKRLRRARERLGERRRERDAPRRLAVLRASSLGQLPVAALAQLAEQSSWVRPRAGSQLVFAGAAQPNVYVVVDGALEARRPGDPTGTVRERVGRGGVVGLANALTGTAASLAWHTAGTTLLAVPSSTVASAVGPLPGPPPVEWAELETLIAETPALAGLSTEDKLGLMTRARPQALSPGEPVFLPGPSDAVVVASGALALPDGAQLRRGSLIGPYGDTLPGHVATARTPARIWTLPAIAGLALLVGASARGDGAAIGRAPTFGAHPPADYPPLASPPGPPPSNVDESTDRRFERKLWWLLILLLLFALFLTGSNLFTGPVWAEMPTDRALLSVSRGTVTARTDGVVRTFARGSKVYLKQADTVLVANRSSATLTFRGGSVTVLCSGSDLALGELYSDVGRPVQPNAALALNRGRLLVDTTGTSPAFEPLALTVDASGSDLANQGAARFTLTPAETSVASGRVSVNGSVLETDPDTDLTCGDGVALPASGRSEAPSPSDSGGSLSPSDTPSPSAGPSGTPTPGVTPTDPNNPNNPTTGPTGTAPTGGPPTGGPPTGGPPTGGPPTGGPTTSGPTTRPPSPRPPSSPPPPRDTTRPVVVRLSPTATRIYATLPRTGAPCNQNGPVSIQVRGLADDKVDPPGSLRIRYTVQLGAGRPTGTTITALKDGSFSITVGSYPNTATTTYNTAITITAVAIDPTGNQSTPVTATLSFINCQFG